MLALVHVVLVAQLLALVCMAHIFVDSICVEQVFLILVCVACVRLVNMARDILTLVHVD